MTDTTLGFLSFALLATSVALWARNIRRVEIPKNRSGFVAAWLTAGMLAITALAGDPGWLGGIPATLALIASTFFTFTVAIGKQKVGDRVIRVGDTIPDFTALDEFGQTFDSRALAGHPVLIKFFRAHW